LQCQKQLNISLLLMIPGTTPLHIAASSNYVEAVNLLLTKGISCNLKNNVGRTPLHLAAGMGCDA